MDDFRAVYQEIKPYVPVIVSLWKKIIEKGLGVNDVLVAIDRASYRAKLRENYNS